MSRSIVPPRGCRVAAGLAAMAGRGWIGRLHAVLTAALARRHGDVDDDMAIW